jgi:hypothetical protein
MRVKLRSWQSVLDYTDPVKQVLSKLTACSVTERSRYVNWSLSDKRAEELLSKGFQVESSFESGSILRVYEVVYQIQYKDPEFNTSEELVKLLRFITQATGNVFTNQELIASYFTDVEPL